MNSNKIIDYTIVSSQTAERLRQLVCDHIKNGWQPYGNIGIGGHWLHQPMVKYEQSEQIGDAGKSVITG